MSRRRILVVGGGIAGASAAARLADVAEIILIEREPKLGEHATGRSAATLSETSGTRAMCALARTSRAALESPELGFADDVLTRPRGLLWIGRHGDEALLDATAEAAAAGVSGSTSRVAASDARRLVPALRPHAVAAGGVFEPDARAIDVDMLLRSYARHAQRRGARFLMRQELLRAARTRRGWDVTTTNDSFAVDAIINAAGAWGDAIAHRCGVQPLGLSPLRRSACLARTDRDVAGWPLVMDITNRCYFEPESGGLLISPADEHPSDPVDAAPDEIDIAWAIDMVNDITDLDVRSVRTSWAGLRTFTADRSPAVGPDSADPTFVWLVGQGGAGIKTAPAMAEVLAATMGLGEWPDALRELGVTTQDLTPERLR